MKDKTLVVLAAGMGSRFGGLKQITPVGPSGEIIADYSVYDAIKAGFTKVVFVIKKENYNYFKENITQKYQDKIKVEFAFQDLEDIPSNLILSNTRTKMLGTAHAIYVTRKIVNEPFAVISADDYYGKESFVLLSNFLDNPDGYGVIGYKIGETLTENGAVKRGVCFEENSIIKTIIESKVIRKQGIIECEPIDGRPSYQISPTHPVSMLMYGLKPNIFSYIEENITEFFDNNQDKENAEYLLPAVIDEMITKNIIKAKLIPTTEKWKGVTYANDLDELKLYLKRLIEDGVYPSNLWE